MSRPHKLEMDYTINAVYEISDFVVQSICNNIADIQKGELSREEYIAKHSEGLVNAADKLPIDASPELTFKIAIGEAVGLLLVQAVLSNNDFIVSKAKQVQYSETPEVQEPTKDTTPFILDLRNRTIH